MRQLNRLLGSVARLATYEPLKLKRPFLALIAAFVGSLGCSDATPEEATRTAHAAVSLGSASVLGCETGWVNENNSGVLAFDSVAPFEGQKSLKLTHSTTQYTQAFSTTVGLIDVSPTSFTIRYKLAQQLPWGTLGVNLDSAARDMNWAWLGGDAYVSLANVPAGTWQIATFPVSASLGQQLVGTSDAKIRVTANFPAGPINLDAMKFVAPGGGGTGGTGGVASGGAASGGTGSSAGTGAATSGGAGTGTTGGAPSGGATTDGAPTGGGANGGVSGSGNGGSGQSGNIVLRFPVGTSPEDVIFGVQAGALYVDDRVTLDSGEAGAPRPLVTQLGSGAVTDIGVSAITGTVVGQANVNLRSARVESSGVLGAITTGDVVTEQEPTFVIGAVNEHATLTPFTEVSIPYAFPSLMTSVNPVQNNADVTLAPGGYQDVLVQAHSTLRLGAGTYYFDSLSVSPDSTLVVDNAPGTVTVFVRNQFLRAGALTYTAPQKYNVLYAALGQVEVGTTSFHGVLVAPNAHVSLYSAPTDSAAYSGWHSGSFFAQSLRAHPATNYRHFPFHRDDCSTLINCATAFGCFPEDCTTGCAANPSAPGCAPPHCTNNVQDADETGKDCGGTCGDMACDPEICAPDCSSATCANPSDGCGGECPAVCGPNEPGCTESLQCPPDYACVEDGAGSSVCYPDFCSFRTLAPPLCGHPGAPCGDECPACTAQCDGRECGPDPNCDVSCGTCSAGSFCNIAGQCVTGQPEEPVLVPDGNGGTQPLPELEAPPTANNVGSVPGQFSVTEQGQPHYTIPIQVPPGRAGLEPTLSLEYVADKKNGEAGVGWRLQGFAKITRCPRIYALDGYARPVKNDTNDRFCLDGERLVSVSGTYGADGTEYRTFTESFNKVVSHQETGDGPQLEGYSSRSPLFRLSRPSQGPDSFTVKTKDGRTLTFGGTRQSLVLGTNGVRHAWLLRRVEDRAGNRMDVSYKNVTVKVPDVAQSLFPNLLRPSTIAYGGHGDTAGTREVRLIYEARQDAQLSYLQGGVPSMATERLSKIMTFVDGAPVKNYRLEYGPGRTSQLAKVFECAGGESAHCKAPTKFEYLEEDGFTYGESDPALMAGARLDLNDDGIPDLVTGTVNGEPIPVNDYLAAAQVTSDVINLVVSVILDIYYPGGGTGASLFYNATKDIFWGPFIDSPKYVHRYQTLLGTRNRQRPFDSIPGNQNIQDCGVTAPLAVLDYDQDGRDDVMVMCPSGSGVPQNGTAPSNTWRLYVSRSRGDGTFERVHASTQVPTLQSHGGWATGPKPVLVDVNGDGLQDVVSCKSPTLLEVRRRISPSKDFETQPLELGQIPGVPFCTNEASHNFVDIDGDGTQELLVGSDQGWSALRYRLTAFGQPRLEFEPVGFPDMSYSQYGQGLSLADLNGDGLVDVWRSESATEPIVTPWGTIPPRGTDQIVAWLNTGGGRFSAKTLSRPQPSQEGLQYRLSAAVDYDSDGRDDFLELWKWPDDNYNLALIPDSQVSMLRPVPASDIVMPSILQHDQLMGGDWKRAGDVDGDGNRDLYTSGAIFYGTGSKNARLLRVIDGQNNFVSVDYDHYDAFDGVYSSNNEDCLFNAWPQRCMRRVRGLVASHYEGVIDAQGAAQNERLYSYKYENARVDLTGHGWLGFDKRSVSMSTVPATSSVTVTTYSPIPQQTSPNGEQNVGTVPYFYPTAGLPSAVIVDRAPGSAGASPLEVERNSTRTRIDNEWEVVQSGTVSGGVGRPYARLKQRTNREFARPAPIVIGSPPFPFGFNGTLSTQCTEGFGYDGFGNRLIRDEFCQHASEVSSALEETHEVTTFVPNIDDWLISNPREVRVTNVRGGHQALRRWSHTYDVRGLLQSVTRGPDIPSQRHKTTYERDAFGNVVQIIEEVGSGEPARVTTIGYDAAKIYPVAVTNALGHVTQSRHDARWGSPTSVVDPNGIAVQHAYDAFGRLVESRTPEGTTIYTLAAVDLGGPVGTDVVVDTQGAQGTHNGSRSLRYDNYGRPIASRTEAFGGTEVLQGRQYDALGRVISETLPYAANIVAPPTEQYAYDHLNRVTKVTHADGSFIEQQYATGVALADEYLPYISGLGCGAGLTDRRCAAGVQVSIDETNRKNVTVTDHRGLVLRNFDGNEPTLKSSYEYGAFGSLQKARDGKNNVTSFGYDAYGRMTSHVDPNVGTSAFAYNGYGELVGSNEPGGEHCTFQYDDLGRHTSTLDSSGTARWLYDEGPSALGRLSGTISPTGQTFSYIYEAATPTRHRGLLERMEAVLDGTPYGIDLKYDDLGRPKRIHYPHMGTGAPIVAEYTYDEVSGALESLNEVGSSATRPLWQLEEAFQGHLAKRETFGNGASTTYSYDVNRRWLSGIETSLGGEAIQALEYGRNPSGQLQTQSTAESGVSREYLYGTTGNLAYAVDSSNGGSPVTTTYGMDVIGNRVSTGSGAAISYQSSRPHHIATLGQNTYQYDASGNVKARSGPDIPGGTQTLEYTPFDLPKRIVTGSKETTFDYSADEQRVLRRDGNKTRYFATDFYQRLADDAGNTLEERFSLFAGGRAVGEIVRTPSGETTLYFHTDRLGTVSTLSTDTGESYHRDYDVWGAPLFSQNNELTRAGFTGHQHDADLGLIDMKGRIYDPLAGRFMTPDPIMQAPFWNQGLNRYSYVFNDPVNNTDPSGWSSIGDRFSTAWNATGAGLSSAFVDTKNDEGLGMAVMGWGAAAVGGGASGASGTLGVGSISATVNNPRFGGGFGGSSATASLYSSSATTAALEQRLGEAPDQRLACGGPLQQLCMRAAQVVANSPVGQAAQRAVQRYGPQLANWARAQGANLANHASRLAGTIVDAARGGGTAARSFFEGTRYTPKVLQQMRGAPGEFHSFPESVTAFESAGTVRTITGGDGVVRQMLEIPGSYATRNGRVLDGVFQFIKEADGAINHRLFVPRAP